MQYKATVYGKIWCSPSIGQCKSVYFDEDKETAFSLVRFKSSEEAQRLYRELSKHWHPNFANLSQIFQVKDTDGYFLGFEKLGTSLEDFLNLESNKAQFCEGHLISELYQNILIALLRVCRHLMDHPIKWEHSLDNIRIVNTQIALTNFSVRGNAGSNGDWEDLVPLIERINQKCGYQANGNSEMKTFLDCLRNRYRNNLEGMPTQPLFWTRAQRKTFTCNYWDLVNVLHSDNRLGLETFTGWEDKFQKNTALWKLKCDIEKYEAAQKQKRELNALISGGSSESSNNSTIVVKEHPKMCLAIIRKCFAHPSPKQDTKQMQMFFENLFPNYIMSLRGHAVAFEKQNKFKIIPQNLVLGHLFKANNGDNY